MKVRRNPAKVNGATGGQRAAGAAAKRRAAATINGGGAVIYVGAGNTRCGWMKGIYCTEWKAEIGGSGTGGGGGVGS